MDVIAKELYANLFIIVFPASVFLTYVPLYFFKFITKKNSKSVFGVLYSLFGALIGAISVFYYSFLYLNAHIIDSFNYAAIGSMAFGGYSIVIYEIIYYFRNAVFK